MLPAPSIFLVPACHPQASPAVWRSAGRIFHPATAGAGHAAVFPGGHRQSAGSPRPDHARRAGPGAAGGLDFRSGARRVAYLPVFAHDQPDRRRAWRQALRTFAASAIEFFLGAPRGDRGCTRARAGERTLVHHRHGADRVHRQRLHRGVLRGDVLLQPDDVLGRSRHGPGVCIAFVRCHARFAPAAGREVSARRREPGVSGRVPRRRGDRQVDGGGAADATALGGTDRRLCDGFIPHTESRQCRRASREFHQQAVGGGDPLDRCTAGGRRRPDGRAAGGLQHAGQSRHRAHQRRSLHRHHSPADSRHVLRDGDGECRCVDRAVRWGALARPRRQRCVERQCPRRTSR